MQEGARGVPTKQVDELRAVERDRLALVSRVANGDQDAIAALYDATNRLVFGLVLRILDDRGAAEEVTLDVYTQVWRQASRYDPRRGTPSAWLLTIARSRAIDRLRSTEQARRRTEPLSSVELRAASGRSPDESAAEVERSAIVRGALDALPPEQREVLELAYFRGLSHSEIAAELGQPLGTVKTRTRLGLIRLRQSLGALEGEI